MDATAKMIALETAKVMLSKGDLTTLDLKNVLRTNFPHIQWNQQEISDYMQEIYSNDKIIFLDFKDNGSYRTYFINKPVSVKTIKKSTVQQVVSAAKKISKSAAVKLIEDSKGRFFTVTFLKKDKSERTLNGVVKKANFMNPQGYINVTERNGDKRQINPRTITKLSINGENYVTK